MSEPGPIDMIGVSNVLIWTYKSDRPPPHQGATGPFTLLKENIQNTILQQVYVIFDYIFRKCSWNLQQFLSELLYNVHESLFEGSS